MTNKILVADDDRDFLDTIQKFLESNLNCEVLITDDGNEAERIIRENQVDAAILDNKMPTSKNGLFILRDLKAENNPIPIIIFTGFPEEDLAEKAIKFGAFRFLRTNKSDIEQILHSADKALEYTENYKIKTNLFESFFYSVGLVGNSSAIKQLKNQIIRFADSDENILVIGGDGSGKKTILKALFLYSKYKSDPIFTLLSNTKETIEKTESIIKAINKITSDWNNNINEQQNITFMLEHVESMKIRNLDNLFKTISNKAFYAKCIGTLNSISTIQNHEITKYFKNKIIVPTLEQIKTDIPILIEHFIKQYTFEFSGSGINPFLPEAVDYLQGTKQIRNVRTLREIVYKLLDIAKGQTVTIEMIENCLNSGYSTKQKKIVTTTGIRSYKDEKEYFDKMYFRRVLQAAHGKKTLAADIANYDRGNFSRKCKELGL